MGNMQLANLSYICDSFNQKKLYQLPVANYLLSIVAAV